MLVGFGSVAGGAEDGDAPVLWRVGLEIVVFKSNEVTWEPKP